MKSTTSLYAYLFLIFITIATSWIANTFLSTAVVAIVTLLSVLKFCIVGFEFMELKSANPFWKFLLIIYGIIIGALFVILL